MMLGRALRAILAAVAILAAQAALAAAPDFVLDLDTGGHRAFIKDVAFSADGRYLVSASDDKTIRIWDFETGVTLRTLRGFLGPGNDGKVFAVALSPDGRTIAAGGYFGPGIGDKPPYGDVRLFDFSTGKVKAVLKAPEYAIYDVAFSPDGAWLAAGGGDGFVYVWQRDEAEATGWKPFTKLDADSWHIQQLAFADGGKKVVATTTDNGIRLWDMPSGAEIPIADAKWLRDGPVMALAVSPDGSLFATGNYDGQVQIWKAADGTFVRDMPEQEFLIGSLTFAAGNERLVASCGYRCADKHRNVVWTVADGKEALQFRSHDGTVYASAQTPDGKLVATAGGTRHAIRLWDPLTGEEKKVLQGVGEPVTAIGIAADASSIAWGVAHPCPDRVTCPDVMGGLTMKLDLPNPDRFFEYPATLEGGGQATYERAVLSSNGWLLETAAGGKEGLHNAILEISHNGKPLTQIENHAGNGYLHAAFTLLDNGARLITGGNDGTLIEYDTATAKYLGEFIGGHSGEIKAIAVSESAGLMLTGSADQTLRLWNLKTRELIVSMFFAGKEFVIWMPQGYYYSSDEGDKMIGWHVNQGREAEGRFIRAGQLKKYLWSPEMVRRAIILKSARQAVLEMRPGVDNELQRLLEKKPPEFEIRLADDQGGVAEGFVAVEITGADDAGADVAGFSILSNSRNVGDFASRSISGDGKKAVIQVPVDAGENRITITGINEFGYLTERSVVAIAKKVEEKPRGKLYVAVVGAEKYPLLKTECGGPCDLRYPVDDAAEFLRVLAEKSAPLYSGMEALVLVNQEALDETPELQTALGKVSGVETVIEPEADNVGDQIADFLDKPTAEDTTIVFIAGHGINIDEDYYFIPSDGRKSDPEKWKRSSLVEWDDIQKAVERAEGVRFLLIDTCHAANAFNPRLEKDAADARIVVFSATAANSTAAELPELGHGVFTYAVIEGLKGGANTGGDGVRLLGLADYIYRGVTEMTNAKQKPFYYISSMENILLARP